MISECIGIECIGKRSFDPYRCTAAAPAASTYIQVSVISSTEDSSTYTFSTRIGLRETALRPNEE